YSGLNKALLTSASWLLGGADKRFTAQLDVRGDFSDPSFSPARALAGQVGSSIVRDAGNRVGDGVGAAKDATGRLLDRIRGRGR
ncbi:MAG: hypothetical protein KC656_31515, partial [Myxococcales bacterium]|nr:hypothetical protein [Myxococcales bacterium]